MKLSGYQVKNFKSCNGLDGIAYSGQIARNDIKVAEFINSGDGGETDVEFISREAREQFALCLKDAGFDSLDMGLAVMADAADGLKGFKKKLKNQTCAWGKDTEAGMITTKDFPYDDALANRENVFHQRLRKTFPNGYLVLNELSDDELWDLWLGWQIDSYQKEVKVA